MNMKRFFLIYPASYIEDIFIITYGTINETDSPELKKHFHDPTQGILLLTEFSNSDWFSYFVKSELKKYYITYYSSDCYNDLLLECCSQSPEIIQKLEIKNIFLFSNLYLINQIISDVSSLENNFWSNTSKFIPTNLSSINNKIVISNSFLFDLFHENYFRVCYGLKLERSNKNDHIFRNLIGHLSSDYFHFSNEAKKYTQTNNKYFNSPFSLVIERQNDDSKKLSNLNCRIYKKELDRLNNEEDKILLEWDIKVLCDEFEENTNRFYFLFDKNAFKIFSNLVNYIDNNFRFIWIDEDYFFEKFEKRIYNKIENSIWSECILFGINIKVHNFYRRYSDFGTDNDTTIVYGDSKYYALRSKPTLSVTHNPSGRSDQNNPGKYYDLEQNIYEYFYNGNKYVLINFDAIPYGSEKFKCYVDNLKSLVASKSIPVPYSLIEETFILTTDFQP